MSATSCSPPAHRAEQGRDDRPPPVPRRGPGLAECGQLGRDDRYLVVNPFFHSFGYKAGILACLVSGAALVPQLVYDAAQAMALVEDEQITVFPGPPTIYQTILDYPGRAARSLSSLRLAVTGAAPVPVALVERMQQELSFEAVLTAYGLTEAVVVTMCRPGDAPSLVASTSGRATADFEIRIAGPDGREVAAGQAGEILLRGPNVMLGYLDDPAATAAAIDPGGWLHTGDVGCLDAGGYLTINRPPQGHVHLRRLQTCTRLRWSRCWPAWRGSRSPRSSGCPTTGSARSDGRMWLPRPGWVLDANDVLAFCRDQLANYKVPRQVLFRDRLPRNPSGKTLKRLLQEEPA